MKKIYIGFKGKNNASQYIVEMIDNEEKMLLTNSFDGIIRNLKNIEIQSYDLIILFGINKLLKDRVVVEVNATEGNIVLNTSLDYIKIQNEITSHGILTDINFEPAKYLCNYAYYNILSKNKNVIFIHIPGKFNNFNFNKFANIVKNIENVKWY